MTALLSAGLCHHLRVPEKHGALQEDRDSGEKPLRAQVPAFDHHC